MDGRTYWFIKLVLPTPLSPRMMTCGWAAEVSGPESSGAGAGRGGEDGSVPSGEPSS